MNITRKTCAADERPNISIFDSARMGIEGDASEDAAIGHIHLSDLR